MILLKKRILKRGAFSIFLSLLFSINLYAQEDPGMETKLEERQVLHQNLQNPDISKGLKDSLILIFKLHDEIELLVSKDEYVKDLADLFLIEHEAKINAVCPTFQFKKLYHLDLQIVSNWIETSPQEAEGYIQILNALIFNIQNN